MYCVNKLQASRLTLVSQWTGLLSDIGYFDIPIEKQFTRWLGLDIQLKQHFSPANFSLLATNASEKSSWWLRKKALSELI